MERFVGDRRRSLLLMMLLLLLLFLDVGVSGGDLGLVSANSEATLKLLILDVTDLSWG
jgi:hypothetical protein